MYQNKNTHKHINKTKTKQKNTGRVQDGEEQIGANLRVRFWLQGEEVQQVC
jgi:hypothetical protein